MKDICIVTNKNENILVSLGSCLGKENINIEGLCIVSENEQSIIHFAVEDIDKTLSILDTEGIEIGSVSDVYVFSKDEKNITGKPGSFGEICLKLKKHNIPIKFGYPAENNRFIFGVDDITKTSEILQ